LIPKHEPTESLRKYCSETVPAQMVAALDEMAQKNFRGSLKPLDESVVKAVRAIEECAHSLNRVSWSARLLVGPVITAFVMALIGVCLVRCEFSEQASEAKRYEAWGRKIGEKNCDAFAQGPGEGVSMDRRQAVRFLPGRLDLSRAA